MIRAATALLAVPLLVAPAAACAQTTNGPTWAFDSWGGEVAVATLSAATGVTSLFLPQSRRRRAPDDPRPDDDASSIASHITAIAAPLSLGAGMYFLDWRLRVDDIRTPHAWALLPVLVEGEAIALSGGLTEIIKRAVGRCRPRNWDAATATCADDGTSDSDDHFAAFPSGHTSFVSTLAGVRLVMAARSTGSTLTALRWIHFGATEALSIATGGLRVTAGAHSVTDVLAGWALGHAVGIGVALMHPMRLTPYGHIAIGPGRVSWSGAF